MKQRPRTEDSAGRLARLLEFCREPRSMADIREEFGDDERWRFSVYNVVQRNFMLSTKESHGYPRIFVTVGSAPGRAPQDSKVKLKFVPASVWDLGRAIA
jgi:hypothetical protein